MDLKSFFLGRGGHAYEKIEETLIKLGKSRELQVHQI